MKLLESLRNLKFREFITLLRIFICSPLYFLPTLRATKITLRKCNDRYGDLHHSNDPTNAYRHALWNLSICEECYKINRNVEKSVIWAQKITTLHENLAPNPVLEKAMDLHNNRIGREIFIEGISGKLLTKQLLDQKMINAVKISNIAELETRKNVLVFLETGEK